MNTDDLAKDFEAIAAIQPQWTKDKFDRPPQSDEKFDIKYPNDPDKQRPIVIGTQASPAEGNGGNSGVLIACSGFLNGAETVKYLYGLE
jgi:hypothetical protein